MFAVVMGAFLVPSRLSAVPISAHRHNGLRPMTAPPTRLAELIGGLTPFSGVAAPFSPPKGPWTAGLVGGPRRPPGVRRRRLRGPPRVTVSRLLRRAWVAP